MTMRLALGLIETIGLPAAIAAADTAVKAAHVQLVGYELAKGGGLVAIKLVGDVGAVRAAVEAGSAAAQQVGRLWSKHVIARPHGELEKLLRSRETIGAGGTKPSSPQEGEGRGDEEEDPVEEEEEGAGPAEEAEEDAEEEEEFLDLAAASPPPEDLPAPRVLPEENTPPQGTGLPVAAQEDFPFPATEDEEICNLCHDPLCPRRKGEPRTKCIHYGELEQ